MQLPISWAGPSSVSDPAARVQRVAHRDLVADDEDASLGSRQQALEPSRIAPCSVVEALAAREGLVAPVRVLPGAVVLDRLALEVAEVDVVEERLLEQRHAAGRDRDLGGTPRPLEARVHAEVERDVRDLETKPLGLGLALTASAGRARWDRRSPGARR